ncbi:MAG: AsmA family protein [Pseudomonadota bacterium]
MRKFLLILLGLVVVLIGGALIVPFLIPTDTYKEQIAHEVERATGRRLTIEGPLSFTVLPRLGFETGGVALSNPPGADSPEMVRLKAVELELKIWPLLDGVLEIDRFVLVEPKIDLEVDAQGKPNWEFGAPAEDKPEKPPEQPEARSDPKSEPGSEFGGIEQASGGYVTEIRLGDIRIENGSLSYKNAQDGASEQIDAINVTLQLPDLASSLQADGSLDYKGETITLQLNADQPAALLQGGASPVALTIETAPAKISFDGQLAAGSTEDAPGPGATGKLDLQVGSIRDLAAWLAEPLAFEGEGLKSAKLSGQLDAGPKQVALTDATIGLDEIEGTAELAADLSGAVPKVKGQLDLGAVDLDPYLPPPSEGGGGGSSSSSGGSGSQGWSKEPIVVPPIEGAEVDFALSLQSLSMQKIEIGKTALTLQIAENTAKAALKEMTLYGGTATGTFDLALSNGVPAIEQQFQLKGLNALPFLSAVADFDRLEGEASAQFDVTTSGDSELALVQGLNGKGSVSFTDGAVVGLNIAGMVRNVATAFLDSSAAERRKTDFGELSGSFVIRDGILTNDDMRLQAPVLRVNGRGQVDLPARTVNYLIEPKAAATLEGQGGSQDAAGVLVPVAIQGPWDDLSYKPDLSGVLDAALKSPEALKEEAKRLGSSAKDVKRALEDAAKKGDADALIQGLTGGSGGGGESQGGGGSPEDAAKNLLKGLFKN